MGAAGIYRPDPRTPLQGPPHVATKNRRSNMIPQKKGSFWMKILLLALSLRGPWRSFGMNSWGLAHPCLIPKHPLGFVGSLHVQKIIVGGLFAPRSSATSLYPWDQGIIIANYIQDLSSNLLSRILYYRRYLSLNLQQPYLQISYSCPPLTELKHEPYSEEASINNNPAI